MGFFKYPYTDLNELNLDWVIAKIKYIEQARNIIYDNSGTQLISNNVQDAITEIFNLLSTQGVTSFNNRVGDVVPEAGDYTASQVTFDNANTGYTATDVQAAIDEADAKIEAVAGNIPNDIVQTFNGRTGTVMPLSGDYEASEVTYNNTQSGLAAQNLQDAVDELAAASGGVTSFNTRTGAVVPTSGDYNASQVTFDDTVAQIGETDVQGALEYVATRGASAQYTTYDNTQSGLTATNVQDAIDEVANDVLSSGVASFNGRTGAVNPQIGDYDLTELGDVDILTPAQDEVLKYDAGSQKWVNGTGGGGGATALSQLSDVDLTTPANGEVLTYDSVNSEWVNAAIPTPVVPSTLNDLSDVTITSPVAGQLLSYDGFKWVNVTSGASMDPNKIIATVEGPTASRSYTVGEWIIDSAGYTGIVTAVVSSGATWTLNTNYERRTIGKALGDDYLLGTVSNSPSISWANAMIAVLAIVNSVPSSRRQRVYLRINNQIYRPDTTPATDLKYIRCIATATNMQMVAIGISSGTGYRYDTLIDTGGFTVSNRSNSNISNSIDVYIY